jgi:hypothetical protein
LNLWTLGLSGPASSVVDDVTVRCLASSGSQSIAAPGLTASRPRPPVLQQRILQLALLLQLSIGVLSTPPALIAQSGSDDSAEMQDEQSLRPFDVENPLVQTGSLTEQSSVPNPTSSALDSLVQNASWMARLREIFDPASLRREIESAADPKLGRGFGEKGNELFVQRLVEELRNAGLDDAKSGLHLTLQKVSVAPFEDYIWGGRPIDKLPKDAKGFNVIVRIDGGDAKYGEESIVFSAHIDSVLSTRHLGWAYPAILAFGPAGWTSFVLSQVAGRDFFGDLVTKDLAHLPGPKSIRPGADDNASGAVALLALARWYGFLAKQGIRPQRTLILLFANAEEEGVKGSSQYIHSLSQVELEHIVENVNLDMIGRNNPSDPNRLYVLYPIGPKQPSLRKEALKISFGFQSIIHNSRTLAQNPVMQDAIDAINKRAHLGFLITYTDQEYTFSDDWSFARRNVRRTMKPVGLKDSDGEAPYHSEGDTADRITYHYYSRVGQLSAGLAWILTNPALLPAYQEIPFPKEKGKPSRKERIAICNRDIEWARLWVGRIEQAMQSDPDFQKTMYKKRMLHTINYVEKLMPYELKELRSLDALSRGLLEADSRWRREQIEFLRAESTDPDVQEPKLQDNLRAQIEEHEKEIQNNDRGLKEMRKQPELVTEPR